ncbi:MAG: response regulator [Erysipelotrichaceae bacterium]|nr:response regulator [Erysipelotrichaceae bacterium]
MEPVRVIIADDETIALEGESGYVSTMAGFSVAGKAHDGLEALEMVRNIGADIVITDIRMPRYDGLWLIENLERENHNVTVIIISAYDDKNYLLRAIRSSSVFDYLTKPFLFEELQETLESARNYRQHFISRADDATSHILSLVLNNQAEEACRYAGQLINSGSDSLQDSRNQIYGWLMALHMNPAIGAKVSDEEKAEVLASIYRTADKQEMCKVFEGHVRTICGHDDSSREITPLITACLQLMSADLSDSNLNLTRVAERLYVTPNYLSSRFSRDMNQSFSSYLMDLRISRSKELLKKISYKVYEVAQKAGFADVSYFNKTFKRIVGITPLQFRMRELDIEDEEETPSEQ